MTTTVTQKGQVTIPKAIRERLGIEPGSHVEFELTLDGRVTLVNKGMAEASSRFEILRGRAGKGMSTDEIMLLTRGKK